MSAIHVDEAEFPKFPQMSLDLTGHIPLHRLQLLSILMLPRLTLLMLRHTL